MIARNATGLPLFALGFISIGFQIFLLRELLIVFNGQEIVIGVALSVWIFLTGAGSLSARIVAPFLQKKLPSNLALIVVGSLPVLLIILANQLKLYLIPPGGIPDIRIMILIIAAVQIPFCLANGRLFTLFSAASNDLSISRCYAWESFGSVFAGILINFAFLWIFTSAVSVWLITLIYFLMIGIYLYRNMKIKQPAILLLLSIVILTSVVQFEFRNLISDKAYPGQKIITKKETPYGQVVVTQSSCQLNYYENGMLLFSSGNEIANEENVHYSMVQHPDPRNVLLISGGFAGMIAEILKYQPDRIDYVELDPSLIMIASKYTRQVQHRNVTVHSRDPRNFLRSTSIKYDAIIVNLPPPTTFQLNRFYTYEFFQLLKKHMSPGAVTSWRLPGTGEYQTANEENLSYLLWNTLKKTFSQVVIIPGNRNYFIASDSSLSLNIPQLIEERNIRTLYVNQYYLNYPLMLERAEEITPGNSPPVHVTGMTSLSGWENHDFYPIAVFLQTALWLDFFKLNFWFLVFAVFFLLLLVILTLNPVNAGLFTGGFTLASAEMILIFSLQVLYGNVFFLFGITITLIMTGLTLGSFFRINPRYQNMRNFINLQLSMAIFAGLLSLSTFLMGSGKIPDLVGYIMLFILALSGSFIAGVEYQLASSLSHEKKTITVSKNYSADMFGASVGLLTVSLFMIPMIGIHLTGIVLICLNLISAGYSKLGISS